ncbi:transporter substrate-binding domain-containing protein [Colwelliaceae bacterium 6441]
MTVNIHSSHANEQFFPNSTTLLESNRTIRISLPDQASIQAASPEHFQQLTNFLKEYWQIWAIDNQINIQFSYLSTVEALLQLEQNKIDVVAITIYQPEYKNVLYSIPYAKFKQSIFRRINVNTSDGFQLAIHSDDKNTLNFLTGDVERQYFTHLNDLLKQHKKFDAIYSTKPWLLKQTLEKLGISSQFYSNQTEIPEVNLHFTTRKNDRELLELINNSLRQVKHIQANLWQEKYLPTPDSNFELSLGKYIQTLTEQEKQYVIDHNVIYYPITHAGFPPYVITDSFLNITERGFVIDLIKHATNKLGIIFKPIYVDNFENMIEEVTQGNAKLLVNIENNDNLKQEYIYSIPYLKAHYSLVYNPSINPKQQFSTLNNKTIAAIDHLNITQQLKQEFPLATFTLFNTLTLALEAVADGEADAFIGQSLTTSYLIKQNLLSNLTSQRLPQFNSNGQLTFAAKKSEQALISLINKSINAISADSFDALYAKWSQSSFPETNIQAHIDVAYRQASYVFFAILLIALIAFWVYYRQLQVRKLTQRKIEHALAIAESARKEAERSAQAKITFLARMSHEIRTPMNGVLGMAEALNFTQLNADQSELLDTLEGSARHLLALLNDVLDFSKMDAGKLTLESVPVNFHLLAKNVIKSFRLIENQRTIDLRCEIDNDITHSYFTDPTRLNQVLNNLVSNAIKFTERGSITLSIKRIAQFVEKNDIYDTVRIAVTDTGIGISKEKQKQLFTPFIQADDDITRKFGGTGLGLSICQEIVIAMGGKIKIISSKNTGSEFYFDLTYKQAGFEKDTEDRRKNSRHIHAPHDDRFEGIRVLIAEDNLVNVKVLSSQLSRLNIDVDIAYDGLEAIKLFQANKYGIVISDCHMPNMDGFELAQKIREIEDEPVWLIAVTADALSGAAEKCLAAGFDDYMAKPCPQEEITNKLNHGYRALQKKKLFHSFNDDALSMFSLFNPKALLDVHNNEKELVKNILSPFIESWEDEKKSLLIALDEQEIDTLAKNLKSINLLVQYLNHSQIIALINDAIASINTVDNSLNKATILNLCNKLDLFYIESLEWYNNPDLP